MIFNGKTIKSAANKFLGKLQKPKDETVEVKADAWKSMYPLFCNQALSPPGVAIGSLQTLNALVDHGIVGDYRDLQKVLMHENNEVAHFALDVLRKIKGLAIETTIEEVKVTRAGVDEENAGKVTPNKNQQVKESGQLMPDEKELQNRVINVLKIEDFIDEKLRDVEKKVEELGMKVSEMPANLTQDYNNKTRVLEDNIIELKKLVESKNVLTEKAVDEGLADIEKKVEELSLKIPEMPENLIHDYNTKTRVLEDNIIELKKLVESKNILAEKAVDEKLVDIEKKVEELSLKIPEMPENLIHDYNTKTRVLEDNIIELKKLVESKNILTEKAVDEKLVDIERRVGELSLKIPEMPENLIQDYNTKTRVLEDNIIELKKHVESKNILTEKAVDEKLVDIERRVGELSLKIPEIPENLIQDYNTKTRVLEDNIIELKKHVESKNILTEKAVAEGLADIEKKVEELGMKVSEMPANITQDYDNKTRVLEDKIVELKKLVESRNFLTVPGQVLTNIKPTGKIPKSSSTISQFTQKTSEESQYSKYQRECLSFLDNTPETLIILLNWVKFLMEKVGRNNLEDILEYYVEIGWISEEVSSMMASYAEGLDYYIEKPKSDVLPEVHTKSLLFIEMLKAQRINKKLSSLQNITTQRATVSIPYH